METILTPETIDNFRSSLYARGRSENTLKAYTGDLNEFLKWANTGIPSPPVDYRNFDFMATTWLNQHRKVWSPKTTGRRLTTLRAWAKWAKWEADDLAEYTPPVPGKAKPHPIPEGVNGVLAMADASDKCRQTALVALCGLCGLRVAEALAVTPKCFDTNAMTLTIRGKGDKERTIPISTKAWELVAPAAADAVLEGRATVVGYKDRFARTILTNLGVRAGIGTSVASHDLRATFGTAVYQTTLDLRVTQELLGHASSKTTEGYTGVTMTSMRAAAEIVPDNED